MKKEPSKPRRRWEDNVKIKIESGNMNLSNLAENIVY